MNNVELYNKWYENGYMEDWPFEKKQRVYNLLIALKLPKSGIALDYGCGTGIFTEILSLALPNWTIVGCDISDIAINIATSRFDYLKFYNLHSSELIDFKFNLIFSHHVLEHVDDPFFTGSHLNSLLSLDGQMLHILPCGNTGSFEYFICNMVKDGIMSTKGFKFFFEDDIHLQRFTTISISNLFNRFGFNLIDDYYSNHFFGSLKWITRMPKQFILRITDYSHAKNYRFVFILYLVRLFLIITYNLQRPYYKYNMIFKNQKCNYMKILFFFSKLFVKLIDFLSYKEWTLLRQKRSGSEMYLVFSRKL